MAIGEHTDHRVRIETGELQDAERRHSFAPRFTPTLMRWPARTPSPFTSNPRSGSA